MIKYDHQTIEKKWQKKFESDDVYRVEESNKKPKYYILDMFPYPSGSGLHVGHPKGYIATDIFARQKMMQGYNVLHPMGWDAFGLPAENYAIKNKVHPKVAVEKNIAIFKEQLRSLGFSYDWSREINTTDPSYYKWTQWIFLQLYKKGLAYQSYEPINWCPSCQTGLANEDLEDGKCERCGSIVEKKPMRQWVLKITDYAEKMLEDLDKLTDWEDSIKEMQKNWIGKSQGAEVNFKISGVNKKIEKNLPIFTTRPDTLFGCTYVVIAPEHEILDELKSEIRNWKEIEKYREGIKNKSELERTDLNKDKTGVKIDGLVAINPVNNEQVPIFIADYVMINYGTGAIMAVPAHDSRDFEFAQKFNIEIRQVINLKNKKVDLKNGAFCEDGYNINSDFLDGLETSKAKEEIIKWLENNKLGEKKVNYKIKDWVFSRQRYWGEPIPIIHCESCRNKKYNYILLHGVNASVQEDFFPWIINYLKEKDHEVFSPELPNNKNPNIKEQVEYILYNTELNEDTVILGHSLGGVVAMKLLEKTNVKINKLVLLDSFCDTNFADKKRPNVEKSCNWKFNFNKIKTNSKDIVVIGEKAHTVITEKQINKLADSLKVSPVFLNSSASHFCGDEEKDILQFVENNGIISVPEKDLPVELPDVKNYQPSGTGESPLATMDSWVNVACPQCGQPAKRETNTMPQWAGSSWYYLRYIDPQNDKELVSKDKEKYWSPVDFYVGGAEHATRHLIYARFWHKFLNDIGVVNYNEPFKRLQHVGLILAEDGRKMSKRWGNVINPDEIVVKYGADSMRVYEMFMGPFSQGCAWNTNGLVGARKFLDKIVNLKIEKAIKDKKDNLSLLHKTIKKVGEDIEEFKFNTAISQMMILINSIEKEKISNDFYEIILKLLAPFAPYLTQELWSNLDKKGYIIKQAWPKFDQKLIKDEKIILVVQINGKVRDNIEVDAAISENDAKKIVLESKKIQKWIDGKEVLKIIFIAGKLVNIVIK